MLYRQSHFSFVLQIGKQESGITKACFKLYLKKKNVMFVSFFHIYEKKKI